MTPPSEMTNFLYNETIEPGAAGAFERKDMCHPFPSMHSRARQESTNKECVERVSLEFVLSKVTVKNFNTKNR